RPPGVGRTGRRPPLRRDRLLRARGPRRRGEPGRPPHLLDRVRGALVRRARRRAPRRRALLDPAPRARPPARRGTPASGAACGHLVSDVPVGVLLSGGIDSSALAALAAEESPDALRTFSIGFEERSFDELGDARLVAERYSTQHRELVLRPDAALLLPALAEA